MRIKPAQDNKYVTLLNHSLVLISIKIPTQYECMLYKT